MADRFLSKTIVLEDGQPIGVEFKLRTGQSIVARTDKVPSALWSMCVCHALSQKIGDAASGFSKANDTVGAFDAMAAVWETLQDGLWTRKATPQVQDLVQALHNLTGRDLAQCQEIIDKADEDTMKALRGEPRIKAEVIRLKAERAAAVAAKTTGGLLDELMETPK